MINIFVDDKPLSVATEQFRTLGDVLEYVKAVMDPDAIITGFTLNGEAPSDAQWRLPVKSFGHAEFKVETGSRSEFVSKRLDDAVLLVDMVAKEFQNASTLYRQGNSLDANKMFSKAINELHEFVNWYVSTLTVGEGHYQQGIENVKQSIATLKGVCDELLQNQLIQAWPSMAKTLDDKMAVEMSKLKTVCETNRNL